MNLLPSASISRLNWATGFGSIMGMIMPELIQIYAPESNYSYGALIGVGVGIVFGVTLRYFIDRWRFSKELIDASGAFELLFENRSGIPSLANPTLIKEALRSKAIPTYDKNDDGQKWYLVQDLLTFMEDARSR